MNSKNYTYIRTLLNGSYVTDSILNRIFCLKIDEEPSAAKQWCLLDDSKAREIINKIKALDKYVNDEKRKSRFRSWLTRSKGERISEEAGQSC